MPSLEPHFGNHSALPSVDGGSVRDAANRGASNSPRFCCSGRVRGSTRVLAAVVTASVHTGLGFLVMQNWYGADRVHSREHPAVATFDLRSPSEPDHKRDSALAAKRKAPQVRAAPAVTPSSALPVPPELPLIVLSTPVPATMPLSPSSSGSDEQAVAVAEVYRQAVTDRLSQKRNYPRSALSHGWDGDGSILFHVERSGQLLDVSIDKSTGHKALDRAALAQVRHAAPFPAIPSELPDELAIVLPLRFVLLDGKTKLAAR